MSANTETKTRVERNVENMTVVAHGVTLEWDKLPVEIQKEISLYGLGRLYADRTSSLSGDEKSTAMAELYKSHCDGGAFSGRATGVSVKARLDDAKANLDAFNNASEDEQALMSKVGVTKTVLTRAVEKAEKAYAKTLTKNT